MNHNLPTAFSFLKDLNHQLLTTEKSYPTSTVAMESRVAQATSTDTTNNNTNKTSPPALNPAVADLPYFTPRHAKAPGTALTPGTNASSFVPTLFTPLTIRGALFRNRILVAPMCQYSTAPTGKDRGALTDYHIATLGHYALKGAALVIVEATAVQSNGGITPNCPGLWSDDQIPALKRVSDFIKSQGALSAIQLGHAGRKASTAAPWLTASQPGRKVSMRADKDAYGWPTNVVGPMGGDEHSWDGKPNSDPSGGFWAPRALSEKECGGLVQDFAAAAKRAVKAGVDVIEIHGAHGYLLSQFLSPVTNRRTDKYGGSFENRTRLLVEIIQAVRAVIPESMPLFLRISSNEWLEGTDLHKQFGSWDVESSIKLAKMLPALGVDLLDVSSGGNHPAQKIEVFAAGDYQTKIAGQIREAVKADGQKLFIGAVGLITDAQKARDLVEEGMTKLSPKEASVNAAVEIEKEAEAAVQLTDAKGGKQPMADVVLVARQFMREPEWVLKVAHQLNVEVAWPSQWVGVRFPRL
jgi:2,4-dienoyl-CoA reductase-like NADH-dependent reductase (Old Yellow Enzyme family)